MPAHFTASALTALRCGVHTYDLEDDHSGVPSRDNTFFRAVSNPDLLAGPKRPQPARMSSLPKLCQRDDNWLTKNSGVGIWGSPGSSDHGTPPRRTLAALQALKPQNWPSIGTSSTNWKVMEKARLLAEAEADRLLAEHQMRRDLASQEAKAKQEAAEAELLRLYEENERRREEAERELARRKLEVERLVLAEEAARRKQLEVDEARFLQSTRRWSAEGSQHSGRGITPGSDDDFGWKFSGGVGRRKKKGGSSSRGGRRGGSSRSGSSSGLLTPGTPGFGASPSGRRGGAYGSNRSRRRDGSRHGDGGREGGGGGSKSRGGAGGRSRRGGRGRSSAEDDDDSDNEDYNALGYGIGGARGLARRSNSREHDDARRGGGRNGGGGGGRKGGRRRKGGRNRVAADEDEDDEEEDVEAGLVEVVVDWSALNRALPVGLDAESAALRDELFKHWDVNSNGGLSYTEVDRAMRSLMDEAMGALLKQAQHKWQNSWKPVIMRSFSHAKDSNKKIKAKKKRNDDYVEKDEFRLLLICMRKYFELYVAFSRIDIDMDRRLSIDEFKQALPALDRWGVTVTEEEAEAEFALIDEDAGGMVLFEEFIKWALQRNLDLGEDDEYLDFDFKSGEHIPGSRYQTGLSPVPGSNLASNRASPELFGTEEQQQSPEAAGE